MLQTPSRRVLWKITSTARKSMNEIRNAPPRSSVNDMRYWSCERICAPTSRRQTRTESTTLHDQLPRTEAQRDPAEPEQHERPRGLQREDADERGAVMLSEPDVDRRLHDRCERQCVRDRVEPRREERQRKHHSREEERHGERERRHSPDVGDPERGRVVEEAESEADDDGECDTQY